jgi:hypothetical protein
LGDDAQEEAVSLREPGTIESVFSGEEDHGIPTVSVRIDFDGGSTQSFGGLCLDGKTKPDFERSLCAVFGVRRLVDLEGQRCVALRYFDAWGETIEGLEAPDGRRFVLTEWRRRHWPKMVKSPLEERRESLERSIESHLRRVREMEEELRRIDAEYVPVEAQP